MSCSTTTVCFTVSTYRKLRLHIVLYRTQLMPDHDSDCVQTVYDRTARFRRILNYKDADIAPFLD